MTDELEPCPICGADLERTAETIQGIALRGCSSRVCPYVIIDLINGREAHNTLSREARVGRLIGQLMDERSVALRIGSALDLTDGSEYVDAILWYRPAEEGGRSQSCGQGGTLLAALESLAAAVEVKDGD